MISDFTVSTAWGYEAQDVLGSVAGLAATRFETLEQALDTALRMVGPCLEVDHVRVMQLKPDQLLVSGSWDSKSCLAPAEAGAAFYELVAYDSAVVINDALLDAAGERLYHDTGIRAYLGTPIMIGDGTCFGALCAFDTAPHHFDQSHLNLLTLVARLIAAEIERELLREESRVARQQSKLQEALEAQSNLLHMVIHDLRTPLSFMRSSAGLLRRCCPPDHSVEQELLAEIERASTLMNRLVNDLVDAAASGQGALRLNSEQYNPAELAHRTLEFYRARAQENDIDLRLRIAPDVAHADGDPTRIQQILLNLLDNALRYTTGGNITLDVAFDCDDVIFAIHDTGPGILPEVQQRIWQQYERASEHGKGLGLGLYIVRRLTEALDGRVQVQSAPGNGTTFTVQLPRQGTRATCVSL